MHTLYMLCINCAPIISIEKKKTTQIPPAARPTIQPTFRMVRNIAVSFLVRVLHKKFCVI